MKISKENYILIGVTAVAIIVWIVGMFIESMFPVSLVLFSLLFAYLTYKAKVIYDKRKFKLENKAKQLLMDIALEDSAEGYADEKSKFRKVQKAEIKQALSVNFYLIILFGIIAFYAAWFFIQIVVL